MSKGSIRQKGSKWYYRFYVENENGVRTQREFAGGRNKRETEAMLRKAMEEDEAKNFVACAGQMTVHELLDQWVEEELKSSGKSNGTVMLYCSTVERIKRSPLSRRRLKSITPEHLQNYLDLLSFGGVDSGGKIYKPLAASSVRAYMAVLQGAFRFAVFPKRLLSVNPMQYVIRRESAQDSRLFANETAQTVSTISHHQYLELCSHLEDHPLLLPMQIAYYTGLRVGEICALIWEDIDFDEQCIFVQRSIRYDTATHHIEIGPTKGKKARTVDFGDTLREILLKARQMQDKNTVNYYKITSEKGRKHYEVHYIPQTEQPSEEYIPLHFVCNRANGTCFTPDAIGHKCRQIARELEGFEGFHFHMFRHTFTSNLLCHGSSPKDVQELLGHADIHLTMNVYAHADRQSKRLTVRSLDHMNDKPEG